MNTHKMAYVIVDYVQISAWIYRKLHSLREMQVSIRLAYDQKDGLARSARDMFFSIVSLVWVKSLTTPAIQV